MRRILQFIISLMGFILFSGQIFSATIWTEDFSSGTYTVTIGGEGNDGTADYFMKTDGTNINKTYTGFSGNFFACQDIDDGGWTGSAAPSELTWSSIDISSYTGIEFSGLFASTATEKIDNSDYAIIQYRIDSGTWTNLLAFENDGTQYNTYFKEDTDFDGDGDGTQLSGTAASFSKSISQTGNIIDIRITISVNSGDEDFAFDSFQITGTAAGSVTDPTNFAAATASTSQINLSWTLNGNSDNVMVAWNSSNTFGEPSGSYSVGDAISGGGTVIYNSNGTSYNHTSLNANTTYYYKAWSVDGSTNYSTGVTANATTYKVEPTNHVTGFSAAPDGSRGYSRIDLSWTENDGAQAPDGYLIKASTADNITDPSDGTAVEDNTAIGDNSGAINVTHGTTSYEWTRLYADKTYYFKIYPYTNSGSAIDYKTDATVPSANTTTNAVPDSLKLMISEVADPADNYLARFVELYNATGSTVDFSSQTWYLCRQTNGGSTWEDKQLTGSVSAGDVYIAANNNDDTSDDFYLAFGFLADFNYGGSAGNGDDGYFLYYDGDHSSGILIDAYGVIDQDGTGTAWEYEDSRAERKSTVSTPTATWTSTEWTITDPANVSDCDPTDSSLPVELQDFNAIPGDRKVSLAWVTESEIENLGFNLYRSLEKRGVFTQINDRLIPGHGSTSEQHEYSYVDHNVVNGVTYYYKIEDVDYAGKTELHGIIVSAMPSGKDESAVATDFRLQPCYPNPFNPETTLRFEVREAAEVDIRVFDLRGNLINTLTNSRYLPGEYSLSWNGANFQNQTVTSGVYFIQTRTSGGFARTDKVIFLR